MAASASTVASDASSASAPSAAATVDADYAALIARLPVMGLSPVGTSLDDPRLGDLLEQLTGDALPGDGTDRPVVAVVGFPFDEGVARNGGRPGTRGGPAAVRALWMKMGAVVNAEYGADLRTLRLADAGDIGGDPAALEAAHGALRKRVAGLLAGVGGLGAVVAIGGGNDQSYPNAAALLDATPAGTPVSAVNLDAHFDVRPLKAGRVHSGTPFRLLLEDPRFSGANFVEFAAQGMQTSAAHAAYIAGKGGRVVWLREVASEAARRRESPGEAFARLLEALPGAVFVSWDVDCVRSADAPGVSAPAAVGLRSEDIVDIAMAAGRCSRVRLVDISEYCPAVEDVRTGRLVVAFLYHFLVGRALAIADAAEKKL